MLTFKLVTILCSGPVTLWCLWNLQYKFTVYICLRGVMLWWMQRGTIDKCKLPWVRKRETGTGAGTMGKCWEIIWVQKFIKRSDENKEPHSHPKSTDTPREYRPYHSTWNGETNSFCLVIKDKKDLWGLWISNYIRLPFYVEFNWVLCDDIFFFLAWHVVVYQLHICSAECWSIISNSGGWERESFTQILNLKG